jgi:hypothetical protein
MGSWWRNYGFLCRIRTIPWESSKTDVGDPDYRRHYVHRGQDYMKTHLPLYCEQLRWNCDIDCYHCAANESDRRICQRIPQKVHMARLANLPSAMAAMKTAMRNQGDSDRHFGVRNLNGCDGAVGRVIPAKVFVREFRCCGVANGMPRTAQTICLSRRTMSSLWNVKQVTRERPHTIYCSHVRFCRMASSTHGRSGTSLIPRSLRPWCQSLLLHI